MDESARARFRSGLRAGVPVATAGGIVATSFGVLATDAGMSVVAALVMSLIVFAGSAQFAAISIVASGGTTAAAVVAAAMMNSRYLSMGVALAPSLPGRASWRALQGQTVVDASWAMSLRDDGSFDRFFLFGATAVLYVTWAGGTLLGAVGGGVLGDTDKLGLDAVFPAFFLALLIAEAKDGRARGVAAAGAVIALALVPFTPAGVPVLVASAAALVGLKRRSSAPLNPTPDPVP
jgi:4-azaleucine resistance transporter AzlC